MELGGEEGHERVRIEMGGCVRSGRNCCGEPPAECATLA